MMSAAMLCDLHVILSALAGLACLAALIADALGHLRLFATMPAVGRISARLGLGLVGAGGIAIVTLAAGGVSSRASNRTWWELAVDAGLVLLTAGMLVGALLRERRLAQERRQQGDREGKRVQRFEARAGHARL